MKFIFRTVSATMLLIAQYNPTTTRNDRADVR